MPGGGETAGDLTAGLNRVDMSLSDSGNGIRTVWKKLERYPFRFLNSSLRKDAIHHV